MAYGLIEYPVEVISGQVRNAFPGFKPIEIVFSNEGSPTITGVEVVLTEPDDFNTDLLGFSLYADFGQDNRAIIDASIITDFTDQQPVLASEEITDSRISFKVKHRPVYDDGTEDAYTNAEANPIIAVHSIEYFDLDVWAYDIEEPKIWRNYPAVAGFVNSDENQVGVDFNGYYVRYDTLDITESVLNADVLLKSYGFFANGVLNASLITPIIPANPVAVPNAGAIGTTDWSDSNSDGLADFFIKSNGALASIGNGGDFVGNYQIVQTGTDLWLLQMSDGIPTGNTRVNIQFRYKSSVDFKVQVEAFQPGVTVYDVPANESSAAYFQINNYDILYGEIKLLFYTEDPLILGYGHFDDITYTPAQSGGSPDLTSVEFIDMKITTN